MDPITPGIYPMLYTFFDADGRIDPDQVRRGAEAAIGCGVHGLAWGGLASEANKLSREEKRALAEAVLSAADGRLPVSITITESTAAGQIEAARHALDHGAAWIVMQPPPVARLEEAALVEHFARIADAVDGPLGIQNAPEFIPVSLGHGGIARLLDRTGNIRILKAEGSPIHIAEVMEAVAGRAVVFNGRNGLDLVDDLRMGCRGCIPGPECADVHAAVFDAWEAGDRETAIAHYRTVLPLLRQLMASIDSILCYGKRLAADRFGLGPVHDRLPGLSPHPAGLSVVAEWAKALPPCGGGPGGS